MPTILLFIQICLVYPFILTTNLIFKNPAVSLFTIYGKISSIKKLRKPLRKMHHRWTDRKTDGQMNRTDFIGPLPQSWRLDHVFPKFESKLFLNYLAWLWAIWNESIHCKKKKYNQHSSGFKEFKNNDP